MSPDSKTPSSESSRPHQARFRFHGCLCEFLKPLQRGEDIDYRFDHSPGIKDPIEALGVPHTEVEAIVVNGISVSFHYLLRDADQVVVFPTGFDPGVSPLQALREPLGQTAFVIDVHLGKLARMLRILGFDTLYRNDYEDSELVDIAERDSRVLLTRDRRLLFHRRVMHGHFVRSDDPLEQIKDIIEHYQLSAHVKPFSRCSRCNGAVLAVNKQDILEHLEPKTILYYETFYRCCDCQQIYWFGSHMQGILSMLNDIGVDASDAH